MIVELIDPALNLVTFRLLFLLIWQSNSRSMNKKFYIFIYYYVLHIFIYPNFLKIKKTLNSRPKPSWNIVYKQVATCRDSLLYIFVNSCQEFCFTLKSQAVNLLKNDSTKDIWDSLLTCYDTPD